MPYCYNYPRSALTVDCFVYCIEKDVPSIILIKRKQPPFENQWALPGGFVEMNELLVEAAGRELLEETGVSDLKLEQLKAFDKIDRDPRGRTISVVFYGFTGNKKLPLLPGSDAKDANWFDIKKLPLLAFDHQEIIEFARKKLNI